jgi:hypothetical protein
MQGTEVSQEPPESKESQPPNNPPAAPPGGTDGSPHPSAHVHAHHSAINFRYLEQLKHRNVIRVGILYLVACWVILDPVHVVFHMLEVPAWANRLVVILMVIGFPVVLLFSWVYEITPEGLKPTAEVDPHRSIRKLTGQRLDRAPSLWSWCLGSATYWPTNFGSRGTSRPSDRRVPWSQWRPGPLLPPR